MLHNEATGLADFFDLGKEAFAFSTPRQARRVIEQLIDDPTKRRAVSLPLVRGWKRIIPGTRDSFASLHRRGSLAKTSSQCRNEMWL